MKNKGFTLIEVMVGVALLGFVTIAAYTFYLNTFQFQVIQERQKDMKMRLQLAMDLLVSDIRAAGFGVTDPSVGGDIRADGCVGVLPASCAPFVGVGGGNIAVTVQDNINVVNGITTDGIVMAERDQFIGALSIPTIAGNVITVGPPVVGTVVAGNLITIGGLFSSAVAGVVTNADNSTTITLGTALGQRDTYPIGVDVYTIAAVAYFIAPAAVPNNGGPALFRKVGVDPAVQVASGIEDLQIAYYVHPKSEPFTDINNNGVYNPPMEEFTDLNGNGIWDPDPTGALPQAVNNPALNSFRAVRVSLSARTPDTNPNFMRGFRTILEPDPAPAVAAVGAPDNFRRATLTRVVELVNDGME